MLQQLENQGRRDLIRGVGNANVEEGKLHFDSIAADQLEFVLVAHDVHTLGHFSNHAGVHLDRDNLLASLHEGSCKVTGTGTDLENDVRGLDA